MPIKKTPVAALLGAMLALAGCSGGDPAQQPDGEATVSTPSASEVTVSTPPDQTASPSPDTSGDFKTAVKFTELVHGYDANSLAEAGELIKPESSAARYVAHQTLMRRGPV